MSTEVKAFNVNIISPRGVLTSVTTDAVLAPGEVGEFQLLPGHVAMLTSLKAGRLVLGGEGKAPQKFAVAGGYLRVDGESVEVLVEQAVKGTDIDAEVVRTELKAAEAELAKVAAVAMDADFQAATYKVEWARARLAAV